MAVICPLMAPEKKIILNLYFSLSWQLKKKKMYLFHFLRMSFAYMYVWALHLWLMLVKSEGGVRGPETKVKTIMSYQVDDRNQIRVFLNSSSTLNLWTISPTPVLKLKNRGATRWLGVFKHLPQNPTIPAQVPGHTLWNYNWLLQVRLFSDLHMCATPCIHPTPTRLGS